MMFYLARDVGCDSIRLFQVRPVMEKTEGGTRYVGACDGDKTPPDEQDGLLLDGWQYAEALRALAPGEVKRIDGRFVTENDTENLVPVINALTAAVRERDMLRHKVRELDADLERVRAWADKLTAALDWWRQSLHEALPNLFEDDGPS